ncbi:MAG: PhoX family protein [Planctomycetota bacterium]
MQRRTFLQYVGAQTAMVAAGDPLGPLAGAVRAARAAAPAGVASAWTPVAYPVPSPGDGGDGRDDPRRFARYEVEDTLVVPEGFTFDVVARWGDRFGPPDAPGRGVTVGYNCDYTGLVAIPGTRDEYWMIVNHEYISARPWLQGYEAARGRRLPAIALVAADDRAGTRLAVDAAVLATDAVDLRDPPADLGRPVLAALRAVCRAGMEDLGVTILHVRQDPDGRVRVVEGSERHRRLSGVDPRTPTFGNCSGATTPWGTFLTCEENFQDQVREFVDARGEPTPGHACPFQGNGFDPRLGAPLEFLGLAEGLVPPPDGRDFGWVGEIDPASGRLAKLRALGRFRHENVAIRAEAGRRLAAYMGDDRRGGHVWKFVSRAVVRDPRDPETSALLRDGTLYAARFDGDFTGAWVPLAPETPLRMPAPEHLATGHLWLPDRGRSEDGVPAGGHVAVAAPSSKVPGLAPAEWAGAVVAAAGRPFAEMTLGDLVWPPGEDPADPDVRARRLDVLRLDAYAMANAAGATPTARPEDLEVHPLDGSVYIAFTDATGTAEGSPDVRVFPDSAGDTSRQYGAVYRLEEDDDDPAALGFRWGRFAASGEVAEGGGGFACADNLLFDDDGNLWVVCDISTTAHNVPVARDDDTTRPGASRFRGVFGNNALFMIPTRGPEAGVPRCFAIGPMECELTGPTFTPDGRGLLLSVQHPGEVHGTRGRRAAPIPSTETRRYVLAARDGALFEQERVVPLGSNFPDDRPGVPPRPSVVCVTRRDGAPFVRPRETT